MGWCLHGLTVYVSLFCFLLSHAAFIVNVSTGCAYFQLWKAYDLFWLWLLLLLTCVVPALRFDNYMLHFLCLCHEKRRFRKGCRHALTDQVDEIKEADSRAKKVALALSFAVDLLRLRISIAILYGNFRLRAKNIRLPAYARLRFLLWDPFIVALWLDFALFCFSLSLTWWRQWYVCCRLGCCRFYLLCMGVVVIGCLIMELPMYWLVKHMDVTWCSLDWGAVVNNTQTLVNEKLLSGKH